MGGVPSRESPDNIFTLRYGSHEIGLIPLVHRSFSASSELQRQFVEIRNDPGVRYYHMRCVQHDMAEIPPPRYTAQDLRHLLDTVEASLFPTNEAFVSALTADDLDIPPMTSSDVDRSSHVSSSRQSCSSSITGTTSDYSSSATDVNEFRNATKGSFIDYAEVPPLPSRVYTEEQRAALCRIKKALRPVPCAIIFVYVNGREDTKCFNFHGRQVNVIGYLGCRTYEDARDDKEPYLQLRQAIIKAAGDRTLERVMVLATKLYHEQFCQVVARARPNLDPEEVFRRKLSRIPFILTAQWNNYPTLKFLYDSAALVWAVKDLKLDRSAFKCFTYAKRNGERGVLLRVNAVWLVRIWLWVRLVLKMVVIRGAWVQYVFEENAQQKDKLVARWLTTNPEAKRFLSNEHLTAAVTRHLEELHREIVRARETPIDDAASWCPHQAHSHDGKLYRIFNSPVCGPILTTVKQNNVRTAAKQGKQTGPPPVSASYRGADQSEHPAGAGAYVGGWKGAPGARPLPPYRAAREDNAGRGPFFSSPVAQQPYTPPNHAPHPHVYYVPYGQPTDALSRAMPPPVGPAQPPLPYLHREREPGAPTPPQAQLISVLPDGSVPPGVPPAPHVDLAVLPSHPGAAAKRGPLYMLGSPTVIHSPSGPLGAGGVPATFPVFDQQLTANMRYPYPSPTSLQPPALVLSPSSMVAQGNHHQVNPGPHQHNGGPQALPLSLYATPCFEQPNASHYPSMSPSSPSVGFVASPARESPSYALLPDGRLVTLESLGAAVPPWSP